MQMILINSSISSLMMEPCSLLFNGQLLVERQRSDTNVDVRIAATTALGRFQGPQAIQALGEALDDSDPAIQYLAMESLRQSTGEKLGNDVRQWKQLVQGTLANPSDAPTSVADRDSSSFR